MDCNEEFESATFRMTWRQAFTVMFLLRHLYHYSLDGPDG